VGLHTLIYNKIQFILSVFIPSLDSNELKDLEGWILHILSVGYSPKQVKEFLKRKGLDGSDVDLVLNDVLAKTPSKQVSKVSECVL